MNHLRLYTALIVTYPKSFRQRFQSEMTLHFLDMSTHMGPKATWAQVLSEYPRTLISEHYQNITNHKGVFMSQSTAEKWLNQHLWSIFAIFAGYLSFLATNGVLSDIQQYLGWERLDFGLTAWLLASLVAACLTTSIQKQDSRTNTLIVFTLAHLAFIAGFLQSIWQLSVSALQYATSSPFTTLFFIVTFGLSSLVVMLLVNKVVSKQLSQAAVDRLQKAKLVTLAFWAIVVVAIYYQAINILLYLPIESASFASIRQDLLLDPRMHGSLIYPISSLSSIVLLLIISFIGIRLAPHQHHLKAAIGIALAALTGYCLLLLAAIPTMNHIYQGAINPPTIVPMIMPGWWWFVTQLATIGATVVIAWLLHSLWSSRRPAKR